MKRKATIVLLTAVLFSLPLTACDAAENSSGSGTTVVSASSEPTAPLPESSEAVEASSKKTSSKSKPVSSKPPQPPREVVKVLIPPGFTVKQIAARMEKNNICSAKEFLTAVNKGNFSEFPLVAKIDHLEKRCYRLEGYLFPDTYEFYTNSDPESVIRTILKNTEKKINGKYSYPGMTIDQIITLASLIEEEGAGKERFDISSVIHNRLKIKMALQLDAPVHYLNKLDPADTQKYKIYYNTRNPKGYQCPGLPAGAISNPSAKSLEAAVKPNQTDYLFFHSDEQKVYHFQTKEEWEEANTKPKAEE